MVWLSKLRAGQDITCKKETINLGLVWQATVLSLYSEGYGA